MVHITPNDIVLVFVSLLIEEIINDLHEYPGAERVLVYKDPEWRKSDPDELKCTALSLYRYVYRLRCTSNPTV